MQPVTTTARERLFLMYSLKSYCVQIARHAELVHGCGIKWTLTLSGIVLKDVASVHRNGMKNTAATARITT